MAEPFGVGEPGGVEGDLPGGSDVVGGAVVHRGRGV